MGRPAPTTEGVADAFREATAEAATPAAAEPLERLRCPGAKPLTAPIMPSRRGRW